VQEHQKEAGALPPSKTPPSVYNASVISSNGQSNHEFQPPPPPDWAERDDEIGHMFGRYSHYANWKENDNRKGRAPWDSFIDRLAGGTRGRHTRNLTGGSNVDDWEPGDFDGVLIPAGKGIGRVILKPDQTSLVYHAKVSEPNYCHPEGRLFDSQHRRAKYAAQVNNTGPIDLRDLLARAKELERTYEQRQEQGHIQNSDHAGLCGDLAYRFRLSLERVENVPNAAKEEALRALLSEMRKGYGIKGHAGSDGDKMISMQAHNKVMHGICQRAVRLLEELLELTRDGSNGSTPR
jgi:hypothetical protein